MIARVLARARLAPRRRRLALCALALWSVGAIAGGVTYAAFSATSSNAGNTFAAAARFGASCPGVTAAYLTGFEAGALSVTGGGLFDEVHPDGGAPTADSAIKRNGDYSMRVASTGGTYVLQLLGGTTAVERVAVRFASLPVADLDRFMGMGVNGGGSQFRVGYTASTHKLEVHWSNGSKVAATSTISAGVWYVIEVSLNVGVNPRTAAWRINDVAEPGTSIAEAPGTFASVHWGSVNPTDDFIANYDDVLVTNTPADYPLGDGKVLALRPNSSAGPAGFSNDDGTAVNATSHTRLDENPMDSISDSVYQNAIAGASYVDLGFEDTAETCFNAVGAVMAYHSAASGQATIAKTSVFDGATESVVWNGNMVSTSLAYHRAIATPAAGQWTRPTLNGLGARFGYWTSGTAVPRWDAFLLEYDVPL